MKVKSPIRKVRLTQTQGFANVHDEFSAVRTQG
jgi:hypothetical protein